MSTQIGVPRVHPPENPEGPRLLQVIETYRDAGRVRHRTMANLGRCATPEEAIYEYRASMRHWRRQLNAWVPTRYLGGRAEQQCATAERRVKKMETEVKKLLKVAKLLKVSSINRTG